MTGPAPIRRHTYSQYSDDDIVSQDRLADSARVLMIVLYRLDLVSYDSSVPFIIKRAPLHGFGARWYSEDRASRSLYKDISRKSNENLS